MIIEPKKSYLKIKGWFRETDRKVYELAVNNFQNNSVFVEIGCYMGRSTVAMAELIEVSKKIINFYAVDHFDGSSEHQNIPEIKQKKLFEIFLQNTDSIKHLFKLVKTSSEEAVFAFSDECVDFIYIDASHEFEFVFNDLNIWYPKMKKSGWISGHDYKWESVKKAIETFCENKKNNIEKLEIHENSWIIKLK